MKKALSIVIIMVIITIFVSSGAFYGGMKYEERKNSNNDSRRGNFNNLTPEERQKRMGQMGERMGGGQNGAGFASGEIISKDDKSVTVKLPDGGSKIVFFSDSTKISKSADGSKDDLQVGSNLMINGDTNQDGSITAKTIQIRPKGLEPSNP